MPIIHYADDDPNVTGYFDIGTSNPYIVDRIYYAVKELHNTPTENYAVINIESVCRRTNSGYSTWGGWADSRLGVAEDIPSQDYPWIAYHDMDVGAFEITENGTTSDSNNTTGYAYGLVCWYIGSKTVAFWHTFNSDVLNVYAATPGFALPYIDRTKPVVSFSSGYPKASSSTSITIKAQANVSCTSWQYKIDNGSWQTLYSGTSSAPPAKTVSVTTGTHKVYIRATNPNNDIPSEIKSVDINTDIDAPTITVSRSYIGQGQIRLSVSSNVACKNWKISTNNGTSYRDLYSGSASSFTQDLSLTEGNTYYIYVRGTKVSNGVVGTSSRLTVDLTQPTVGVSITDISNNEVTVNATSNVLSRLWEYNIGSGWVTFETSVLGVFSASETIEGLNSNTEYSLRLRVTKVSNSQYKITEPIIFKTTGGNILIKIGDEWIPAQPFVKVNGEWKEAIAYIKIENIWKMGV